MDKKHLQMCKNVCKNILSTLGAILVENRILKKKVAKFTLKCQISWFFEVSNFNLEVMVVQNHPKIISGGPLSSKVVPKFFLCPTEKNSRKKNPKTFHPPKFRVFLGGGVKIINVDFTGYVSTLIALHATWSQVVTWLKFHLKFQSIRYTLCMLWLKKKISAAIVLHRWYRQHTPTYTGAATFLYHLNPYVEIVS